MQGPMSEIPERIPRPATSSSTYKILESPTRVRTRGLVRKANALVPRPQWPHVTKETVSWLIYLFSLVKPMTTSLTVVFAVQHY